MKKLKLLFCALVACSGVWSTAAAASGSTINPTIPAPNSLISSGPMRGNFAAAFNDINNLFGQSNGGSSPLNPVLGQVWLNTSTTPFALEEWDGGAWVVLANLNATTHSWVMPSASLPLGTSVSNPGTGMVETVLPVQSVTQTSRIFVSADLFKKTRRSNSGTPMTDLLPAASTAGMANGAQINIVNVDATAPDTITAGQGTTIAGSASFVIQPGRDTWWAYDAPNATWRGVANTGTSILYPGVAPNAAQLWGGSVIPGDANPVMVGNCLSLSGGTIVNTCGMTYPGGGIPNSTGSAWGTPYSTSGSGPVLALAASPTFSGTLTFPASLVSTPALQGYSAASYIWGLGRNAGTGLELESSAGFSFLCNASSGPQTGATCGTLNATALSGVNAVVIGSGATGLLMEPYTAGNFGALYSGNVTPGASNYSLLINGGQSQLNGTANVNLSVNNTPVVTTTASGATVNGTFSVAGNLTLPGLATTGTIAGSACLDSSGHLISNSATNCYSGAAASNYKVETSAYAAIANDFILADTSGGALTVTLPSSATQFAQICFLDAAGTFGVNTLTVAGNGLLIMGSSQNMTVSTSNASFCLVYYTAATGWRIK